MKKINNMLIGEKGSITLEQRVFNIILIVAILMTTIGLLFNLKYGTNISIDLMFLLFWVMAYHFRNRVAFIRPLSYIVLVFGVIPYNWINSSGILGAVPYYNVVFIGVICLTTLGWQRRVLVSSLFLIQGIMVYVDVLRFYELSWSRYLDSSIHLISLTACMGLIITTFENTYISEKKRNVIYSNAIEEQYRQQLYCMKNLEELNSKLKSERHDFNNHIGTINGLILAGDTQKSVEYTSKLVEESKNFKSLIDFPYAGIRALLNFKLSVAVKNGVELILRSNVPEGLSIDEYDVGIMLGNLIDNSIEALKLVDDNNKKLELRINFDPDYLVIRIENTYSGSINIVENRYPSTKSNSHNHGYGLLNVSRIVNKYKGMMSINHENQKFVVDIALLIE